jgi:hypothetical protein
LHWLVRSPGFWLAPVFAFAGAGAGDKGKDKDASEVKFAAGAKLVLLPTLVTDKSGNHISGLKQEYFTVLENGAQQKIATFEEITERPAPVVASQKSVAVAPRLHVPGAGGAMEQD